MIDFANGHSEIARYLLSRKSCWTLT